MRKDIIDMIYIVSYAHEVLNVMTGVFVNSAIKTRERDHETLIQNKRLSVGLQKEIFRCSPTRYDYYSYYSVY